MHMRFMRQVHQIVDNEAIIARDLICPAVRAPSFGLGHPQIGQQVEISTRRITNPDPHKIIPLHDGISGDTHGRILRGRARHLQTLSGTIEQKAVIAAAQCVSFDHAHGEREQAMRTHIFERDDASILAPVQHHRLFADRPSQ